MKSFRKSITKPKKNVFSQEIIKDEKKLLGEERFRRLDHKIYSIRQKRVVYAVALASVAGFCAGGRELVKALIENSSFTTGISMIAKATGFGVASGALLGTGGGTVAGAISRGNYDVKKATLLVGKGLSQEAKSNIDLQTFLDKYKYVFIDKKLRVRGTNRPRLFGIGRMRLKSSRISSGWYAKNIK